MSNYDMTYLNIGAWFSYEVYISVYVCDAHVKFYLVIEILCNIKKSDTEYIVG